MHRHVHAWLATHASVLWPALVGGRTYRAVGLVWVSVSFALLTLMTGRPEACVKLYQILANRLTS